MSSVEARLTRLEKAVRFWKSSALLALVASGAIVAAGAKAPTPVGDVLQARRFEVVNDKGVVIGRFGQVAEGGSLGIYGTDGRLECVFAATPAGGSLWLSDGDHRLLRAGPQNGAGALHITDRLGREHELKAGGRVWNEEAEERFRRNNST